MGVSKPSRALVFIAVLAIHLLFLSAIIKSWRGGRSLPVSESIVSTLLYMPVTGKPALAPNAPRFAARTPAILPSFSEAPVEAPTQRSSEQPSAEPPIDWSASAHQAVLELLKADASEKELSSKMGTGWWLALEAKQQRRGSRPAFPWSRQPLHGRVDFDPDSFVMTFTLNRRCQVSVFLILPGFGCALGHLDPDPGRSDLFDPKYVSGPIDLPASNAR